MQILMDRYCPLVFTIVNNKLKTHFSKEDIEECVSDVFMEIFKGLDKLSLHNGSFKSLLALIAKRKSIDLYRKEFKHKTNTLEIDDNIKLYEDNLSFEDEVIQKDIKASLISTILSLGEPDSEILIRKYFFYQSSKEISSSLNIKVNTIDKKVSRALEKLKNILGGCI